ncbi:hypothetical protein [Jiangella mangrovi]|uniref:VWA domain-containing protein n=1 Tax=Jiangella mangrovi TaxID=1524084 RepID=A0A7W9GVG8_9ACTN|nr:hypothetical protein [Jiangella mangrovi]MBB5790830.1 hypothetical protein [Jiangella mangrovi]
MSRIRFGYPGSCPPAGRLTILLFDDSASISTGADAIGGRYVEAGAALEQAGGQCRCGRELAAILHFGAPTSHDIGPTPIGGPEAHRLRRGLRTPVHGPAVSLLRPSLRIAKAYARAHPRHAATLVVLSDFQLDDGPPGPIEELADFDGDVHAIVLRSAPLPALVEEPRIDVTAIGYDTVLGTLGAAVFAAITAGRPGRRLRTGTEARP